MALKKFFPFQITKRVYLFGIFIIIVPVMVITLAAQVSYYDHEITEKTQTLNAVAHLLDKSLDGTYTDILRQEGALNKSKSEQVKIINRVLQPKVNHLVEAFPEVGMGYYSVDQHSKVAFGPHFSPSNLTDISRKAPYMEMYKTGKPLLQTINSGFIWRGKPILSLTYPIYRNGILIGHVWTNTKLANLYAAIYKDIVIFGLIGLLVTMLALFVAWKFFRLLKSELERFSEAALKGKPAHKDGLIPELSPVVELIQEHSRRRELVVARLTREISRRRDIEGKLKAANEKIINTLEGVTDAFYALDGNLRFTYINGEAEKQMSLQREHVLGMYVSDVFPNQNDILEIYVKAMAEQKTIRFQRYFNKMGKWLEITAYPSADGLGVYLRDVTEQKNAHEQIAFQANVLDHVRNAVIATDANGIIVFANKHARSLYGLRNDIIEKDISVIDVRPRHLMVNSRSVQAAIKKRGYWEGDIEVMRPDGISVPVHRIVSSIKNSDGSLAGFVSVGIDLTERNKLEKEIARLDQLHMVGEMAAGIGHEVRNPMTTVRGFIQLLAAKENDSVKQERFNLMIEELDRANSIITEYLSLAKNKKVELKSRNINMILGNLYPLLQADAMVSDKYINTELRQVPDLLLDENEISQLIINLVRNGLEAMPPGGTVTIRTYQDKGDVLLAVSDQGPGIDPEIIDRIGTPFVTTKDSGTGLGLAVSYSIASRHNARIEVQTGKKGTTFFVRFRATEEMTEDYSFSDAV